MATTVGTQAVATTRGTQIIDESGESGQRQRQGGLRPWRRQQRGDRAERRQGGATGVIDGDGDSSQTDYHSLTDDSGRSLTDRPAQWPAEGPPLLPQRGRQGGAEARRLAAGRTQPARRRRPRRHTPTAPHPAAAGEAEIRIRPRRSTPPQPRRG